MDRIFTNSNRGPLAGIAGTEDMDPDSYEYTVRSLIDDAVSYEESDLSPNRETSQRYYYGLEPSLDGREVLDLTGDPPVEDEDTIGRSTVVSTDVKDTVMSILPSLMRIFGGTEHALEFSPTSSETSEVAMFATEYVRKVIWSDNPGFSILYGVFKDALTVRYGAVEWDTDNTPEITERTFTSLTRNQMGMLLEEAASLNPEVVSWNGNATTPEGEQTAENVVIRYTKVKPKTIITPIPPEDFRISRNAKSVKTADIVGYECYIRASEVIEEGYDKEFVESKSGTVNAWSEEKWLRNPGFGADFSLSDHVRYGSFYVRADKDGDGINELRHIVTIGDDYEIVKDELVDRVRIALFTPDYTPHTAIGDSAADLVMDIQKINTNLLRAGFDSLSQSIFPRVAFNQLTTNIDDMLDDSVGGPIRVNGNPMESIYPIPNQQVAQAAFDAKMQMDGVRQMRTGISEASKGLDPRALQSTNVVGVEAVLTGAQERIELIALVFAHGGMKDLYEGLLQEIVDNAPNRAEVVKMRGKWTEINPSLFDANLSVEVNPALGKGSDQARLMILNEVRQTQMAVVEKFGMGNGVVGPQELRNTIVDMLTINGIRNHTRYFRELTEEQVQAMETAPQEPTPEMVVAKATMEEVRSKTAMAVNKSKQKDAEIEQASLDKEKDRDLKRDEITIDAFLKLTEIASDGILASAEADAATEISVTPRNVDG